MQLGVAIRVLVECTWATASTQHGELLQAIQQSSILIPHNLLRSDSASYVDTGSKGADGLGPGPVLTDIT